MLYIDKFITYSAAPKLLSSKLFPNAKEITESMGIYNGCKKIIELTKEFKLSDTINVVVVGDGFNPRTGALIAVMSKWNVHSIDPSMKLRSIDINRLNIMRDKIENCDLVFETPIIICCPHSHATLTNCLKHIKAPTRHIVSIPCCVKDDIGEPDHSYVDNYILSPKRDVNIYLNR